MHGAVNHLPSGSHPEEAIDYDGIQVVFHPASRPDHHQHPDDAPVPSKEEIEQETMDLLHESLEQLAELDKLADHDDGLWNDEYYDEDMQDEFDEFSGAGNDHEECNNNKEENGNEFIPEIGAPGEGAAGGKQRNNQVFIGWLKNFKILPDMIKEQIQSQDGATIGSDIDKLIQRCNVLKYDLQSELKGHVPSMHYEEFLAMSKKLSRTIATITYLKHKIKELEDEHFDENIGKVSVEEYKKIIESRKTKNANEIDNKRVQLQDAYNVMKWISLSLFAKGEKLDEFTAQMKSFYVDEELKKSITSKYRVSIWEKPEDGMYMLAHNILTERQINYHIANNNRLYMLQDYEANREEIHKLDLLLKQFDEVDKTMEVSLEFTKILRENATTIQSIRVIKSILYMIEWAKKDYVYVKGLNDTPDYDILEDIIRGNYIRSTPKDPDALQQSLTMDEAKYQENIDILNDKANFEIQRDNNRIKFGTMTKDTRWDDFKMTPEFLLTAMVKTKRHYPDIRKYGAIRDNIESRNESRVKNVVEEVRNVYAANMERMKFCIQHIRKAHNMLMRLAWDFKPSNLDKTYFNTREIKQQLYNMKPYMVDLEMGHMKGFSMVLNKSIHVIRIMKNQMNLQQHMNEWNQWVENMSPMDEAGNIIKDDRVKKVFTEAMPLIMAARLNSIKILNIILMPGLKNDEEMYDNLMAFKHYMLGTVDALLGDGTIQPVRELKKQSNTYKLNEKDIMMNEFNIPTPDVLTFKQLDELNEYLFRQFPTFSSPSEDIPISIPEQHQKRIKTSRQIQHNIRYIKSIVRNMYKFMKLTVLFQFLKKIDDNVDKFQKIDNREVYTPRWIKNKSFFETASLYIIKSHQDASKKIEALQAFLDKLSNADLTNRNKDEFLKEINGLEDIEKPKEKTESSELIPIPPNQKTNCIFSPAIQSDLEDPNGMILGDMWGYATSYESDEESESEAAGVSGMFIGMPVRVQENPKRNKNKRRYTPRKPEPDVVRYKKAVSRLRGTIMLLKQSLDQTWHNLQMVQSKGIDGIIAQRKRTEEKITEVSQATNSHDTSPAHTLVELYNFAEQKNKEDIKENIVDYVMASKKVITVFMQRMLRILVLNTVNFNYSKGQIYEFIPHFNPIVKKQTSELYSNVKRLIHENNHSKVLRLISYIVNCFIQLIKNIFKQYTKKVKVTLQQEAITSFILHNHMFLNPFKRMDLKTANLDSVNLMNIAMTFERMIQHILSGQNEYQIEMVSVRRSDAGNDEKPMTTWINKRWDDFYISLTNTPLTTMIEKLVSKKNYGTLYPASASLNIFPSSYNYNIPDLKATEESMNHHFESIKKKIFEKVKFLFNDMTLQSVFNQEIISKELHEDILKRYEGKIKKIWNKHTLKSHTLFQYRYLHKKTNKLFKKMSSIPTWVEKFDWFEEGRPQEYLPLGKNNTFICYRSFMYVYTHALYNLEKAYWKNTTLVDFTKGDDVKPKPKGTGWVDYESDNDNSSEEDESSDDDEYNNKSPLHVVSMKDVRKSRRIRDPSDKSGVGYKGKKHKEDKKENNSMDHSDDDEMEPEDYNHDNTAGDNDDIIPEYRDEDTHAEDHRESSPAPSVNPTTSINAIRPWKVTIKMLRLDLSKEDFTQKLHMHFNRDSIVKHHIKNLLPKAIYQNLYVTRSRVAQSMRVIGWDEYQERIEDELNDYQYYTEATIMVSGRVFAQIIKDSIERMEGETKKFFFGDNNPKVTIEESNWEDTLRPWVFRYVSVTRKIAWKIANAIESMPMERKETKNRIKIYDPLDEMYMEKQKEVSYKMKRASDTWLIIVNHRLRHTEEWNVTYLRHLSEDMYFIRHCFDYFPIKINPKERYDVFKTYSDFYHSNLINAAFTAMAYNPDNYEIGRKPDANGSTESIDMYGGFRERELRRQIRQALYEKRVAWNKLIPRWTYKNEPWPFILPVKKLIEDKTQKRYNDDCYTELLRLSNVID